MHQVVDDVEPQARTTLAQLGRKERIIDAPQVFRRDAGAIIAHFQLDPAAFARAGAHGHATAGDAVKAVDDGVVDQVGQHLPHRARIAAHADAGRDLMRDGDSAVLQRWPQGQHDFRDHLVEQELASLRTGPVHRHLLETGHQVHRPVQVAQHDLGGLVHLRQVRVERRLAQAGGRLVLKQAHMVGQRTGRQQAIADRRIQFVRHARHQ